MTNNFIILRICFFKKINKNLQKKYFAIYTFIIMTNVNVTGGKKRRTKKGKKKSKKGKSKSRK